MDQSYIVKGNNPGLREVHPGQNYEYGQPGPMQTWHAPQESALREYLRVLIKRKFVVLGCLVAIFGAVLIASLKMTPIYEATGRIAINKPDNNLVTFKDSNNAAVDYYDPTDLDTEVSILQSDLLASLPHSVDLLLANLPYIARRDQRELADDVRHFEPEIASVPA